jgi:hypothetical protein
MKKRTSRMPLLLAAATLAGFGAVNVAPAAVQTTRAKQRQATIQNGATTRSIEADMFNSYAAGIGAGFMRSGGHTPYEWGTSRACAKMVRKNRMHAKGISHSRI